ncbi:DUF72 domain-containing protein [Nitrospirillum viridazoti]|uniref:DUF72 domain-containing protein n=1 Tax=Nitrospirillum viridazoti CBAmc TaxID=1441467 RepID=A0A248K2Z9_9PROT|nr:DUF72 domain-containing protein [Nitrospirillum amazonense]ASG25101.1 hypothetical protein Y958_29470 [Nitrospirillum amazonense CBAmc]TWB28696.1 uncharacterized protein YecE (DUF72 family) [Nitrospirillum amazonense]
MAPQADVRIGISGWTYAPWRGAFYPEGLPQRRALEYASGVFRSIEINGTFYGLQTPDVFARWNEETPDGFVFAVKAPRYITHIRRLKDPVAPLANFLASGLLRLGNKLGPLLWQFPPSFKFDAQLLGDFLALLPHDTEHAADLAHRHDDNLKAHAWMRPGPHRRLRHAVEIRHESFRAPAFTDLLRQHGVALVCADTVEWPRLMDLTSDFVYCRLHGSSELYRSGYGTDELDRWARRVAAWAGGRPLDAGDYGRDDYIEPPRDPQPAPRDVYLYFDNTDKLRAPDDARALVGRLTH